MQTEKNGFSGDKFIDKIVDEKNERIIITKFKIKLGIAKMNDKNGIINTRKIETNKIGNKTENIGTISKFIIGEIKLKLEYKLDTNGNTPSCAEMLIANDSAKSFGKNFNKNLVIGFAENKTSITQK